MTGSSSSWRTVYSKAEADELVTFGWKIIDTEAMDDGRTRYTLKRLFRHLPNPVELKFNNYPYYQKKQPMPTPCEDDDLEWLN
jgi:hypothetical protein